MLRSRSDVGIGGVSDEHLGNVLGTFLECVRDVLGMC
jgi:hypothetical protein